ncbi:unannotated protein [freshwater metagenome]
MTMFRLSPAMTTRPRLTPDRRVAALLATIAYLPALLSSPGKMPSDTKLYLYLDPGRLISQAPKTWDPSQMGGWVPHQMIAYLWPSGPWFWCFDRIGAPDWVAHRLWIATILFLGGLGVMRLSRALGMATLGAAVAALVYQLSPYILPYISRTSVMLLPWASLGWMTLLTMRAVHRGGWRYPALLALVVLTVSSVNATAFATILPGPILWALYEWHGQRVDRRQVLGAAARIGILSAGVSAWWVAMLSIQGNFGADVLAYSETLEAVSHTASSTEVMRSLGYWLFYVRDPFAASTTASIPYQESARLIIIGFLLLLTCLLGLVITRFAQRRFATSLVIVGLVLSVGVHPFEHPSPLPALIRDTGLGLALRSSTRALPLLSLGLGLGAAALVVSVRHLRPRLGTWVAGAVVLLIAAQLPSLWTAHLVDPALQRDQRPPAAWMDAAAALDASTTTSRVLQLPGAEFGAFRWGFTVDQPVAGITQKALLTRDLLPLGSSQLMDLLYALDNRVQTDSLDPASIAPVARLLAADQIWVTNDLAFDRFRTPRPEVFADLFRTPATGLGVPIAYGTPTVNRPAVPMIDEQSVSDPRIGTPIAPVMLVPVEDPVSIVRAQTRIVVVDGSGDGVVDSAAAGLLHGDELVRYANDLTAADWASLPSGTVVLITDSNRDREQQWRGSQDTLGMTESGGPSQDGVHTTASAQRLPIFENADPAGETIATLDHGLTVQATAYGEPFAYLPEDRAAMAVDGDTSTGWRFGQHWNPIGETFTLTGANTGELHLLQLQGAQLKRQITAVDIAVDGHHQRVELGPKSLTGAGQTVAIPLGTSVAITVTEVADRPGAPQYGEWWVGFAEIGPVAQEWVRPPTQALTKAPAGSPTALVLHRERVRATDRWRSDPEPTLARALSLTTAIDGRFSVTLRLSPRAADSALDALAGEVHTATSNRRLAGVPSARASAAFDGDSSTRWVTPFNIAVGSSITVPLQPGSTVSSFEMMQPNDVQLSPITEVRVSIDGHDTTVAVPAADTAGASTISFPAASGDSLTVEITAVAERTTTERRYGQFALLPAAISEITGLPIAATTVAPNTCRSDLLTLDGAPVPLQVDAAALSAGEAITAAPCAGSTLRLAPGEHHLLSAPGVVTGIDVDGATLIPTAAEPAAVSTGSVDVHLDSFGATSATVTVAPCPKGCWLIFGEGYNKGWEASVDGRTLSAPRPVSGGANGWQLAPSDQPTQVSIHFTPQTKLNLALGLSAVATVCCLGLALWPLGRRRLRAGRPVPAADPSPYQLPALVAPWHTTTRRRSAGGAALLVGACLAFVSLWWALGALVIAAAIIIVRRPRLAGVAALVGISGIAAYIVYRQHANRFAAGGGWPSFFEHTHKAGLFLIFLLLVTLAADEDPHEWPDDPIDG